MSGTVNPLIVAIFKEKFQLRCMQLVVMAYQKAISSETNICGLEEEDITGLLSRFIDDNPVRLDWNIVNNTEDRLRDKSKLPERGFAKKAARIDLRFTTINNLSEYRHYMEAKNLKKGDSALKRRYITTGIDNFISTKYHEGFLAGYILNGNTLDNIDGLNKLLISDNRDTEMINIYSHKIFGHECYISNHSSLNLKHMFFEFS